MGVLVWFGYCAVILTATPIIHTWTIFEGIKNENLAFFLGFALPLRSQWSYLYELPPQGFFSGVEKKMKDLKAHWFPWETTAGLKGLIPSVSKPNYGNWVFQSSQNMYFYARLQKEKQFRLLERGSAFLSVRGDAKPVGYFIALDLCKRSRCHFHDSWLWPHSHWASFLWAVKSSQHAFSFSQQGFLQKQQP